MEEIASFLSSELTDIEIPYFRQRRNVCYNAPNLTAMEKLKKQEGNAGIICDETDEQNTTGRENNANTCEKENSLACKAKTFQRQDAFHLIDSNLETGNAVSDQNIKTMSSPNSYFGRMESDDCDSNLISKDITTLKGNTEYSISEYLCVLMDGMHVAVDSGSSIKSKPVWFDEVKYRRGQEVAMKYYFCIASAGIASLILIFTITEGLLPFIFTGMSDTPFKSFKRYLSTAARIKSWYTDDIWNPNTEGHKHLKNVRVIHESVRQRLNSAKPEEIESKLSVTGNDQKPVLSNINEEILEDFRKTCPLPTPGLYPFKEYHNENRIYFNQMEMAATQMGFVGLFVLFPNKFGAHCISDQEQECFIYLWRCIGYLLGIEDKYNLCNGNLDTVKKRCRDIVYYWTLPSLGYASRDWEHMSRCAVEGIFYFSKGKSFEVLLLFLCNILGLNTPHLSESLTFLQKCVFYLYSFTVNVLMRLPGILRLFNWLMEKLLKYSLDMSPEKVKIVEEQLNTYENTFSCPYSKKFSS